jgi:hypothetical protein
VVNVLKTDKLKRSLYKADGNIKYATFSSVPLVHTRVEIFKFSPRANASMILIQEGNRQSYNAVEETAALPFPLPSKLVAIFILTLA